MSRKPFATRKLKFEPLERRELLAVTSQVISGDLYITADHGNDQVEMSYDGVNTWYVDTDGDPTNANATAHQNVNNIFIGLEADVTVIIDSETVTSAAGDARFEVKGNLTIQGSRLAEDVINLRDDAALGGVKIDGDLVFTGRGGGDTFAITGTSTPQKVQVGGHVSIDMGSDAALSSVGIEDLEMTGTAASSTRNVDVSTSDLAQVELENLDTGGGTVRVSSGPAEGRIILEQVTTGGGNLVVLSDDGRLKPGSQDRVRLDDVDLGAGNLTVRAGAGPDVVTLDYLFTTGDVFIDLMAGHDRLVIGNAVGSFSTVNNLWIRGHSGRDIINVQNVTATANLGIRTHKGADFVKIGGTGPGGVPTVSADSMEIHMGPHNDRLRFLPLETFAPHTFRARGGPGPDRTQGEINLFPAYRRRIRKFEDRNL